MDRLVKVRVLVDEDGILAAHLGQHALDMILARRRLGSLAIDRQPHPFRPGKGDHGHVGMIDKRGADLLADAKETIDDTCG